MGLKTLNSVGGVSVGLQPANVILSNADVISNNLTVFKTANLGNVSNVKIFGGSEGQLLRTDGNGNLTWISGAAGSPGGSNTQIQFNDDSSFNGVSNFTYDKNTNLLTVNGNVTVGNNTNNVRLFSSGAISSTGNLSVANINTGGVLSVTGNANIGNIGATNGVFTNISGTLTTASQPNITAVGNLVSLSVIGNADVGNLGAGNGVFSNDVLLGTGNGGSLTGANLVSANFFTGTLTTASQPNITAIGTLSNLSITGNANVGNLGTAGLITATANIQGGNLRTTGILSVGGNANVGNLGTAGLITATANIQGGNLRTTGILSVGGNANVGNLGTAGLITATANIQGGNLRTTGILSVGGNANVGNLGVTGVFATTLSATGNANVGNIGATNGIFTNVSGNGALLTNINGSNVTGTVANATFATTAGTVTTNAQPNITSIGILTSLSVSGNANVDNLSAAGNITGNFFIGNGSQLTGVVAVTAQTVTNAAQPNITSVGTLTSLNIDGNLVVGNNLFVNGNLTYLNVETVAVEDPIIQLQTGANGTAPSSNSGKDIGTALNYYDTSSKVAFMGWDTSNAEIAFGSNVSIANEVVTFNQLANTRSGNLLTTGVFATTLSATGNANTGNIGATNGVFTNVSGNGAALTNITGANVTGTVANATFATSAGSATTAGTVTTNAQPNITSVGTLTSLSVAGNANVGNLDTAGIISASGNVTGNFFIGNGSQLTGVVAITAQTVTTNAQPNITSVGTLTSLSVSGNSNVGNLGTTGVFATTLSSTGNANVGNLGTAGFVTATGNIQGNNILVGTGAGTLRGDDNLIRPGASTAFLNIKGGAGRAKITLANDLISIISGSDNITFNTSAANSTDGGTLRTTISNTGLFVTGVLSATGNANVGNIGANNGVFTNVSGNGALLTNINGSNVTGTVANATFATSAGSATTAGTVTTNAQPNITSVGTLTSLSASGTISTAARMNAVGVSTSWGVTTVNSVGAFNAIMGTSNNATWLLSGTSNGVFKAGIQVYDDVPGQLRIYEGANAITFGSNNLSVPGHMTATRFISTVATGTAPFTVTSTTQVANLNAATAGTVTTNAQPNITSVGTLSSLSVSGNANVGNLGVGIITATGNITAPNFIGAVIGNATGIANGTSNITIPVANGNILFGVANTANILIVSTSGLEVAGTLAATTKSFLIDHPTRPGHKLQYGSLESPYHGVRLTGEATIVNGYCLVKLPDYIKGLVRQEGSQVQITPIRHGEVLWVEEINVRENFFIIKCKVDNEELKFYWSFTAIRKDVDDLNVEFI